MALVISYFSINKYQHLFKDKKTVLVGGCFDLFHYGHLQFLKKAKKQGSFLIIALESDEFIKKRKNRYPFHKQKQRGEILASLLLVDLVILLPFFTSDQEYFNLVKKIKPSIIAVTKGDPQIEKKRKQAKEVLGRVVAVTDLVAGFSATKFLEMNKKI